MHRARGNRTKEKPAQRLEHARYTASQPDDDIVGRDGIKFPFVLLMCVKLFPALVIAFFFAQIFSETSAAQSAESSAEYDVVFNATWSASSHPVEFPASAHFSGLVGGLHNELVRFWEPGQTASQGIQNMAELGVQSAFLSEVNVAIAAGTANRTLAGSGISGGTRTSALRFRIDSSHPLVTLTSMVAPSPDWFVGVRGLPLLENGAWVAEKTVTLYPYDAGTDSGTTFTSPDQVTIRRGVISAIGTPPLGANGSAAPLGTFKFTRAPSVATLGNISTRVRAETGDGVLIAGFVIQGSAPKEVIIRAAGPALRRFGVNDVLANPQLELHDATTIIATNDNWQTTQFGSLIHSDQTAEIQASGVAPTDPAEPAIVATLPPGSYTAIVRGVNSTTGVSVVEAYDLSPTSGSILANISTRGFVQTGENVMIGGFIVVTQPTKVIIRATGPSLSRLGVAGALADPQLELHDANSAIATNDNWQTTQVGGVIASDQAAAIQASGLAPTDPAESAIVTTLAPGNYTALVRGVNASTGVGLVEVYRLH